ncbi:MAG: hypothetical protein IIV13_00725, partial [Bacteroidaceae bacterium]|nr:hypothetical protein [Bacteroidaceae bacterium]
PAGLFFFSIGMVNLLLSVVGNPRPNSTGGNTVMLSDLFGGHLRIQFRQLFFGWSFRWLAPGFL